MYGALPKALGMDANRPCPGESPQACRRNVNRYIDLPYTLPFFSPCTPAPISFNILAVLLLYTLFFHVNLPERVSWPGDNQEVLNTSIQNSNRKDCSHAKTSTRRGRKFSQFSEFSEFSENFPNRFVSKKNLVRDRKVS